METMLIFWIILLACKIIEGAENQKKLFYSNNSSVFLNYARNVFGASQKMKFNKFRLNKWCNVTEHVVPKAHVSKNIVFDKISFKVPNSPATFQDSRFKRGALHLYNMITCSTGCNPLIYKGYGCFCGFLGSGFPVDGIDRCCKKHDWCYNVSNCPTYLEYVVPYFWKCWSNRPFCAIDHGELGGPGSCADRLCECDRAFSECLRKYPCPTKRAFCKSSPLRFFQNAIMFFT